MRRRNEKNDGRSRTTNDGDGDGGDGGHGDDDGGDVSAKMITATTSSTMFARCRNTSRHVQLRNSTNNF